MASKRDPIHVVEDAYACFQQNDIDKLLQLVDEKCDWEAPGTKEIAWAGSYHGREQVKKFFAKLDETLEFLEFKPEQFVQQDNTVIVMGREKDRVKKTGKTFDVKWAHCFKVENGKITSFHDYQDTATIQSALH